MAVSEASDRFREAVTRRYTGTEHEDLRRVAFEAAQAGAPEAAVLARSYAELCAAAFPAPAPLLWPRRTAGDRLRVAVLLPVVADESASRALGALAGLPLAMFEPMLASIGPKSRDVVAVLGDAATKVAELPLQPGFAVSRALAARDADVLVDMAGLAAAVGPLLAYRPARAIWTVSTAGQSAAVGGPR